MHTLTLTEIFAAPPARVFSAWTDAAMIKRWFAPGDMKVAEAAADPRPGGRYRIVMESPDGAQRIVGGEYREIVANERLSFSFKWEHGQDVTLVELAFKPAGAGATEMTLVHSQFTAPQDRDMHGQGWAGCFANLRTFVSS
jgi:uncharacterized protein YndB with AHSA1/START domain